MIGVGGCRQPDTGLSMLQDPPEQVDDGLTMMGEGGRYDG